MLWSQDQGNGEMVHGQRDGHSLASPTASLSADASPEPPAQSLGQRLEGNLPSQVSSGAPSSVLGRPAGRAAAGWCQVSREEPEVSPARAHSHPSPAPPGTLCPAQARLSREDRSVPSPQTSCPGRGSPSIGAQPGLPGPFIPHQPSRKTPLSPRLWMGTAGPRVTVSEVLSHQVQTLRVTFGARMASSPCPPGPRRLPSAHALSGSSSAWQSPSPGGYCCPLTR